MSQSSSANKVVESDGFHQSGGVRGNEARLKRDRSRARCLVMRTPPSHKGGGSDVVKCIMGRIIERYKGSDMPKSHSPSGLWGEGIGLPMY